MRVAVVVLFVAVAGCQGPKGDPGDPGAPGMNGTSPTLDLAGVDLAGADLAGVIQPQAITCTPGAAFCATSTRVATCTLSGADAVLGTDCTTAGSPTNAATCVTTGCPAGQAACCRRTKQLYKWNFSQPALVGEVYVAGSDPNVSVGIGKGCAGSAIGLAYAILSRTLSVCPSNATTIYPIFDRAVIGAGATLTLPATGFTLIYNSAAAQCTAWSGTARLDSDVPDWSITLNATCTSGALTGTQVVGSMSGAE